MPISEQWKTCPGYEGAYEVSSEGRVRSVERMVRCRLGFRLVRSVFIKQRSHRGKYWVVQLSVPGREQCLFVHRLVCQAFHLNPTGLPISRHKDGDNRNSRADNLEWGTYADNEADKRRHGTALFGERHPNAVLNDDLVRSIRARHAAKHTALRIAADLGIKRGVVGCIVRGEFWKHIT